MRVARLDIGQPASADLRDSILSRDLSVGGARWVKGRRLDAADLAALVAAKPGSDGLPVAVTVLLLDPDDLHEDEAAQSVAAELQDFQECAHLYSFA